MCNLGKAYNPHGAQFSQPQNVKRDGYTLMQNSYTFQLLPWPLQSSFSELSETLSPRQQSSFCPKESFTCNSHVVQTFFKMYLPKITFSNTINFFKESFFKDFPTHTTYLSCRWAVNLMFPGFPGGAGGKEPTCQCRRHKKFAFDPWVGKILWKRAWQPTPVFLPGESHGQRSYDPWGSQRLGYISAGMA